MKVVYYHRHLESGFHIHAYSSADILYVPDENLILFREQHGSFGGQDYSFTDKQKLLEEARAVMQGSTIEGVKISNVREFDYDDTKVRQLIQDAKLKSELERKVRSGIEELLSQKGFD